MSDGGVCIVAPPKSGPGGCTGAQREWIETVRRLAEDRSQKVTVFRTVMRTSQRRSESGRRIPLLDPWEADRLYKLVHRGHGAVFQAGSARVLLDPLHEISTVNSVALARLVRYKAFFRVFDGITPVSDLFQEFDSWMAGRHIDSHRDCRVLPLHMFSPGRDWDLTPAAGRDEFSRVHGKAGSLVDEKARPWKQPNGKHGQEALLIANHPLPQGYHWDVNATRTTSRLVSLVERWKFVPGSYANVSPDGHIRGGQSSGVSATREGAAPRPPEPKVEQPSKGRGRRRRRPDGKNR